jgi:hypothetical protein
MTSFWEYDDVVMVPTNDELPSKVDPFDLAPVKARLERYRGEIVRMQREAGELIVRDDQTLTTAGEMASQAKKLNKAIEDVRKVLVDAPNNYVKAINNLAKGLQTPLTDAETGLKRKIGTYQAQVELARREAELKAQEAARKLQAEIDAEAKAKGVEAPKVELPVIPTAPSVIRTAEGSASIRKVWKFQVEDAAQVPREYLIVNESAIRRAVANGVRQIPGVNIFEESTVAIRT